MAVLLLSVLLGACATGDALTTGTVAARLDASSLAVEPQLTVFTTRNAIKGASARPWFGTERARKPTIAQIRLKSPYDSATFSLAAFGDWRIDGVQVLPDGLQWSRDSSRRDVLVYVHGFNQTFEQAALDAARLSDGIKFRGETILFTWPSRSALLDYIYDRESAMWSRDAFENMLRELINHPAVGDIHVVAHSMGTMLSVEALRQLYARMGETAALKMGAIVLAAPDIDVDVFTSSVRRIGGIGQRITVITTTNDRALEMLRKVAGGAARVGAAEKQQLEALGVRVLDVSQYGGAGINHDLFLSSEQVRALVRRAIEENATPHVASGGTAEYPPAPFQ